MKIEKIKPIPKYIQKKIKLYDDQLKTAPFGRTRFYAYFTKNDSELVKVTVAVREYSSTKYSFGPLLFFRRIVLVSISICSITMSFSFFCVSEKVLPSS